MSRHRKRVLVLAELPEALHRRLAEGCAVDQRAAGELDDAGVARLAAGCQGLLSLLIHQVGELTLGAAGIEIVANCAVGTDNVDLAAAARNDVTVTNTPGVLTEDTADLTWALILAVCRRLLPADRALRRGDFPGWRLDGFLGRSLGAASLGVIGAGRIGRAVLARAAAFGMRRLYASRSALPPAVERRLGCERRGVDELLAEADVISLHLPLTADTRHLIDAAALARCRPGAVLINTSRGPVVDEAALVSALDEGRLGGAGLDVYEHEPRVHPELVERDDVVLLPHVGSATRETRFRMAELCVEALLSRLVEGRRPAHAV